MIPLYYEVRLDCPLLCHCFHISDILSFTVGDAIEFDIHDRPNLVETPTLSMTFNGESLFPPNSMPKGKYVYRLISYIPENEESVGLRKANIMADPAEITPDLPVSMRTKEIRDLQDDMSSESGHLSFEDITLASMPVKQELDIMSSSLQLDCLTNNLRVPRVGDVCRELIREAQDVIVLKNALWITGTIQNVQVKSNGTFSLQVLYCDKMEAEVVFPNSDFEVLQPTLKTPSILCNEDLLFACDCNPKYLGIGDFVECLYQNGQNSGKWWQGRIASAHLSESTVDVAYCDGDFECGIPLCTNYIRLLAKGSYDAQKWLVGAKYYPKSNNGVLLDEVQVVDIISISEKVLPGQLSPDEDWSSDLYCKIQTSDGDDILPYESVVVQLFSRLKAKCHNAGILKMWPAKEKVISEISELRLSTVEKEKGVEASSIMPAVANSCLRAFNSSECDEGFAALMHVDSTWNFAPNKKLKAFLLSFMVNGPEHEGHQIRSELRTELAFKYMKRVHLRDEDSHPTFDQMKQILELPLRDNEDGILSTLTESKTRQLSQTLHFCSQSLNALANIISLALQDILSGKVKLTSDADRMPIIGHLISANVRDCLKMAVKCAVQTWLHHGCWLLGIPGKGQRLHRTANEQMCENETHSLVKAYGTIVSHLACLFCVEEEIAFGDERCCFILCDVLDCELEKTARAIGKKRITSAAFNEFKRNLKLRFVLSLGTDFSRDLQLQLSRLLDFECEVSLILR